MCVLRCVLPSPSKVWNWRKTRESVVICHVFCVNACVFKRVCYFALLLCMLAINHHGFVNDGKEGQAHMFPYIHCSPQTSASEVRNVSPFSHIVHEKKREERMCAHVKLAFIFRVSRVVCAKHASTRQRPPSSVSPPLAFLFIIICRSRTTAHTRY